MKRNVFPGEIMAEQPLMSLVLFRTVLGLGIGKLFFLFIVWKKNLFDQAALCRAFTLGVSNPDGFACFSVNLADVHGG